MSIVPRPKDYKPKGLDGFKYEDMLPLLKRADEIRARKRLEETAARETAPNSRTTARRARLR